MSKFNIPEEIVSMGVISNDVKGGAGGTHYWATVTHHFKVGDTREEFIKRMLAAYDIVQANLIRS